MRANELRVGSARVPLAMWNAHGFTLFNALNYTIVLGPPAVLYAKSLGATETILGLMAALTPLLAVLQIPCARFIPRLGYRRFMLAGWSARTAFLFVVAVAPLLVFLPPAARLWLLVGCLFFFNLLRGIVSGVWLPWLANLLPERARARFLSRDLTSLQLGGLASQMLCALALGGRPAPVQFSAVFLLSALAAVASLLFIIRIPEVDAPETVKASGQPVPWRALIFHPPFFRLLILNVCVYLVTGGLATFTVAFLRDGCAWEEGPILWLSAASYLGGLLTLPVLGRALGVVGSKPLLRLALGLLSVPILGWTLQSARLLPATPPWQAAFFLLYGVGAWNYALANWHLAMATIPAMGRNHFFAAFSVVSSLAMGASPLLWGVMLDAIGPRRLALGPVSLDRFGAYFLCQLALVALAIALVTRLAERRGPPLERVLRDLLANAAHLWRLARPPWQR